MQSVGFLYALGPGLRRIHLNPHERKKAEVRHSEFFNTHPYLANVFLGMVLRMEEEYAEGHVGETVVVRIKSQWAGPLAALGDSFFWATWRPLCSLFAAVVFAVALGDVPVWVVVASFLVPYNVVHLWIRFSGISRGYNSGRDVISWILRLNVQKKLIYLRWGGTFLALALVLYCLSFLPGLGPRLVGLGLFSSFLVLSAKGIGPTLLFYSALVVSHLLDSLH